MIVLPEILQKQFLEFKTSIDLNTSTLTQAALEIFLRSSMYRFHVKRTKEHYKNKMSKVLVSSIDRSCFNGFEHPEGLRQCVCNAEDQEIEKAVRIIKSKLV